MYPPSFAVSLVETEECITTFDDKSGVAGSAAQPVRGNSPPARVPATPSHDAPALSASSSRRTPSSEMSAGQPYAAATAASGIACASASHCGQTL